MFWLQHLQQFRDISPLKKVKKNARNVTFRCPLCLDKDFGCVDNGRINTKRCSLTMISRYKLEKSERSIHIIKGKILGLQSSRYGLQSVADMMEGVLFWKTTSYCMSDNGLYYKKRVQKCAWPWWKRDWILTCVLVSVPVCAHVNECLLSAIQSNRLHQCLKMFSAFWTCFKMKSFFFFF